jgi:uncharacterized protein YggT (Ycf19 family)
VAPPPLTAMVPVFVTLIELYCLLTVTDVLLAWVQPEPERVPRRVFHVVTEPVQRLLRPLSGRLPTGGWDLSPLFVLLLLGSIRVWLLRP